jgi:hypothetical protein
VTKKLRTSTLTLRILYLPKRVLLTSRSNWFPLHSNKITIPLYKSRVLHAHQEEQTSAQNNKCNIMGEQWKQSYLFFRQDIPVVY